MWMWTFLIFFWEKGIVLSLNIYYQIALRCATADTPPQDQSMWLGTLSNTLLFNFKFENVMSEMCYFPVSFAFLSTEDKYFP